MLSSAESSTLSNPSAARKRYARIPEVLPVPNLIELQLESFQWFTEKGLRELFDEISPIKDFTGKVMELQFLDYEFGDPKYSEEECRTKDLTFSRPLYVNVELLIKETGEIQRQRVYMGDYPWMTDLGTFVINGAERVVVSQLVRSPGRLLQRARGPGVGPDALQRQGHPEPRRLARVRDEQQGPALGQGRSQAEDRGDDPAPRRRLRDQRRDRRPLRRRSTSTPSTRSSRTPSTRTSPGRRPRRSSRSTRSSARAIRPRATTPASSSRASSSTSAATTSAGSGATSSTRSSRASPSGWASSSRARGGRSPARTSPRSSATSSSATAGCIAKDDIDHLGNRRIRANGELIQNAFRIGLLRMERVVRERMTIQEIDKATPNALINIRPVVAAMKEFFGGSQLSQFMDQTNPLAELTSKRRLSALGPGRPVARARRLRRPRRPPQPLRPDLPDRDAGRSEHRPDRLARDLRPDQQLRLHRDAVPPREADRRLGRPGPPRPTRPAATSPPRAAAVILAQGRAVHRGGRRGAEAPEGATRSRSGRS